ncbi:MAG: DUF5801 repeats-in-toxin domain-containing protein, partial [Methylococcales bacterium]|nr:DUF5801 repeats-in-toxin domain-containing protein [Methylococcales bacterium]
ADGDTDVASYDVGAASAFTIKDDGPEAQTVTPATAAAIALDETTANANDSDTADFSVHFNTASVDYGTDGKGDVKYSWSLTGINVVSGLYALDANDKVDNETPTADGIGQGDQILLNVSTDGLTITGSEGGTAYFTLVINEDTGVVTFTQSNNLWHPTTSDHDESATLTLAAGVLEIEQTVTDADGDTDVASYDVGAASAFTIKDDGPTAATPDVTLLNTITAATLDESVLDVSTTTVVEGDGVYSATTNVAAAFEGTAAGNFGTDGAGTTSYAVSFTGAGTGSGLFILDPSVTTGDVGKGAEITLQDNTDGTVSGMNGPAKVFTISVSTSGEVTFAYEKTTDPANIWHADTTSATSGDDASLLKTVATKQLVVKQTLVDADGDSVTSDGLDIGTGKFFKIEDDGPTLTSVESASVVNNSSGSDTGTSVLDIGTDVTGTSDLTANITGWNGTSVSHIASALTSNSDTIYYFVNSTDKGTLYAYTSTTDAVYDANNTNQSLVFTLTYGADGDYDIEMDGSLDAITQTSEASFDTNLGANVEYIYLTDADTVAISSIPVPLGETVVMTVDSMAGTVNSSQQGIAAGGSNWVGNTDPLIFYYTNAVKSAEFKVDFQGGSGITSNVHWVAYGKDASGNTIVENGDVSFTEGSFTSIPTSSSVSSIVHIELSQASSGTKFRVTGAKSVSEGSTSPVNTTFDVAIVDADGDMATSTLAVEFTPPPSDPGLIGGHIDVDTYSDGVAAASDKHEHEYDDKYDVNYIDAFDYGYPDPAANSDFSEIQDTIDKQTNTSSEYFQIILVNAHLSTGANIVINGVSQDVTAYGDGYGFDAQVYTLNANNANGSSVILLTSLVTNFDAGAIGNGGIVASETGLVKTANGGTPTVDNEWRNGALTLWAAEVTNVVVNGSSIAYDATYTLDKSHSTNTNIITGITDANTNDTSQALLWEQTTFWHRGANNTAPGDADYYFDADVNNVVLTTSPLGDIVSITKSLTGTSVLDMNEGDDLLEVKDVKGTAKIIMGGGDDTITTDKLEGSSTVNTGVGDDTITVFKE